MLKRGMVANPQAWQLPFEIGFLHYIHRVDYNIGARYFDLASKLPGAPDRAGRFAAYSYDRGGSDESSIRIWEAYIETTDDPYLKEMAERYIAKIKAGKPVTPDVPDLDPGQTRAHGEAQADGEAITEMEEHDHVTSD